MKHIEVEQNEYLLHGTAHVWHDYSAELDLHYYQWINDEWVVISASEVPDATKLILDFKANAILEDYTTERVG